ncbi:MAG: flagellar hook-length control protein FliK, partial [Cereibacter changlensis]
DLSDGEAEDPLAPAVEPSAEAATRPAPVLPGATEREMPLSVPRDIAGPTRSGPADQSAPPRPLPPEVAPALVDLAKGSGGGVEVALSPAELGSVTLRMEQEGAGLRVTVSADRPDTLDLLRRNADQLQQELRTAGFAGSSFSFTDRGGSADPGAQRQPAAPPPERERLFAAPFSRTPPSLPPQGGGLDLRM